MPDTASPWATAGVNAAADAVGHIIGIAAQKGQYRRQYHQQKKLNERVNKPWAEWASALENQRALEMWDATGYGAQKKQMQAAGLNPALMYGMSGGGGQTTGTPGTAQQGVQAQNGGEPMAGATIGLNTAMATAQMEVMKSVARKNNVEADKTEGVDTAKAKTEIDQILQTIKNQQAQEELTKVQTAFTKFELSFEQDARKSRLEAIDWTSAQALEQLEALRIQNKISNETQIAASEAIIKQAAQIGIVNILLNEQAKTEQTKQVLNLQQAKQLSAKIVQDWTGLNIEQFKAKTQLLQVRINEELKNMEIELNASEKIRAWVETITDLIPWKSKKNPVGFQRNSERKY